MGNTTRIIVLFTLLLTGWSVNAEGRNPPPDSLAVTKLFGTTWTLTKRYTPSHFLFHRLKKNPVITAETITIYSNEFHTDVQGAPYQVCSMRHRNNNEFWLDCKITDQYIYRVLKIDGDQLVMDEYIRPYGKTEYVKMARKYYTRKKN